MKKTLLAALVALAAIAFSGCRSTPAPLPITVSLIPAPPASVEIRLSTQLSGTVTSDAQNGGVDWTVTCGSADCGSFSPIHTASGANTTYTAPATVPTGSTVTVAATSTDSTNGASASAMITINPVASVASLTGNYAFYLAGTDSSFDTYVLAGSMTLDGSGDVTGGELDFNNVDGTASVEPGGDAIVAVGSSYSIGEDGQGTITLATSDVNIGVAGTITLAVTVVNNNHALITNFDDSATSVGSLDFQVFTPADLTQITSGYSYAFAGADPGGPLSYGGVWVADGLGDLNNAVVDFDIYGTVTTDAPLPASYTAPDASGRGTIQFGSFGLAYYIIGPEAIRFVRVDAAGEAVGGSAFGQGTNSTSVTTAAVSGTSVFVDSGTPSGELYGAAGLITADGMGNVTGYVDDDEEGFIASAAFSGTYVMGTSGFAGYGSISITSGTAGDITFLGLYLTDPNLNLNDPNNTSGGGGALIVDLDAFLVGLGNAIPQTASPTFAGNYGLDYQGYGILDSATIVGEVFSDGSFTVSGTGNVSEGAATSLSPATPLSATYVADPNNPGRFTASLLINGAEPALNIVLYQASSGQFVHTEDDLDELGTGVLEQQQ
ncbi:MAG: hypothetical protein WA002_03180 [Candidatus Acidiferrales bacterium]